MFNFTLNQLNSPFDDSAFFIKNVYRKKAFLLDCGRLGCLENSAILSLGDIFVSHTHMDHFVGFDRIMRGSLTSHNFIRVFGPEGIIGNVDGKFRGYTWNLVDEYIFGVEVIELLTDGNYRKGVFLPKNKFVPVITSHEGRFKELGEGFTLEYEFFDHRTLSVGYRISEPVHYHIEKDKLAALGYREGPWIGELKRACASGSMDQVVPAVKNGEQVMKTVAELDAELIMIAEPQIITYITDIAPKQDNIEKAVSFAKNSTLLIIEAVFMDEDEEHAQKKNHLTLSRSKEIFARSGSEYVRFTHFASRYEVDKAKFMDELYKGMNGRVFTKNER